MTTGETTELTPELSKRLSDLRSTMLRLGHSLELAVGEADDLASRGAVSRSEVADPLDHARRSVQEALEDAG